MAGLNHVEPGGAPLLVRLSPTVTMTKLSVGGPMDNNAYLLQTRGGSSVLIDAANDSGRLLKLIGDEPVDTIVTTHRHPDHWQALAAVADRTGARLVAGRPDADAIEREAGVTGVRRVWDGDQVPLGDEQLTVLGLVGHTPGSITLVYGGGSVPHLFTGDSLFPGGPGRTHFPEDFGSLMDDLEQKVFDAFDDDAVVHPGHGDDTTLGRERPHLSEWRRRGW
jgi:glyoxylase-like metal-dependent hydrolase (beta-lactamase superfamily II)